MSIPDIFGRPLQPDPKVALKTCTLNRQIPGPQHKVQYVVELVGPRTIPTQSAASCLDSRWRNALGDPEIFVMAASDDRWRPYEAGDQAAAYDSLAFAWDFVSRRGSLSNAAAQNLLNVAEQLGKALSRRAMPMPPPSDVEPAVRAVEEAAEHLDIGVGCPCRPAISYPKRTSGSRAQPSACKWAAPACSSGGCRAGTTRS